MLSIFRTNQILAGALFIFYILLVRGMTFFIPSDTVFEHSGVLSEWIYQFTGTNTQVSAIFTMIVLLLQAMMISYIVMKNHIAKIASLYPGLFYILIVSALPNFLNTSPLILANTFYIIALGQLFRTYNRYNCAKELFNVGFWIGVGSLFHFSVAVFFIIAILSLTILRSFSLKEILMLLIGAIVPYFLLGTVYFYYSQFDIFWASLSNNLGFFSFANNPTIHTYISFGFFSFLIGMVAFSYRSFTIKTSIAVQKKINVLYWCIALVPLILLFQAGISTESLLLLSVPLSIFIALMFIYMRPMMAELLHFVLLVLVLAYQFVPILGIF